MSMQLSVNKTVCSEYQRLLEESQRTLEIWNKHRAEFCQFRFIGREARRRTPTIASQACSSLHSVAEPRMQLLTLLTGVKNGRT